MLRRARQERVSNGQKIIAILTVESNTRPHPGMAEEVVAGDCRILKRFCERAMVFGETVSKCRLDVLKIAPRHGWPDIHPVGMERLQPALASPEVKEAGVFEKRGEKLLVITRQSNDGGRPVAARKSLDDTFRIRTAIDVIAQENRHRMLERPRFQIGRDALGHLPEQIVTTMNIADAVDDRPIWHAPRRRIRRRTARGLEEGIRPAREFDSPDVFERVLHLG